MKALEDSSEREGKGGWEGSLLQVESGGSLWEKSSGDTQASIPAGGVKSTGEQDGQQMPLQV